MKRMDKKAQVMQNIGALGVGVVTLSLILAVAFLATSQIETQVISDADSVSSVVINLTVDMDSTTAFTGHGEIMEASCNTIRNGSNSTETLLVNTNSMCYNCSKDGVQWGNCTSDIGLVEVNYTFKGKTIAYNSTGTLNNATGTIPGWVPLILLVAIGGIILGLVSAFKKKE